MNMRACLALLIIIAILASPSFAKPSAFATDNSDKDLQDLESMLSGEHRGAQYAESVLPNDAKSAVKSAVKSTESNWRAL